MSSVDYLPEEKPMMGGFYNRDAYKRKKQQVLVLQTGIAGIYQNIDIDTEEGKAVLESLVPGTELKLYREPDNKYDEWAIAVYTTEDKKLGYVTRFKNETIARLMDIGRVFTAKMDKPEQADDDDARRKHSAPTEDDEYPFSIYMEL